MLCPGYESTLAIVGDNKNARSDPEVIAPLSKLEQYMGGGQKLERQNQEIIQLLKKLVAKDATIHVEPGREWGRFTTQSQNMNNAALGTT